MYWAQCSVIAGGTTEPHFFVSCVQQSASIPEFQGCPGYNTLLNAISFLDIRRNHKGQNQVSKEQVPTALLLADKIYCCFCSVVNNHGTSCAQTYCTCMCYWRVPCNSDLRNGTLSVFTDNFRNSLQLFTHATCEGKTWTLAVFNQSFLMSESWKPLKSLQSSHGTVAESHAFLMQFSQFWSTTQWRNYVSAIRKS
jgi:hypothetical protein